MRSLSETRQPHTARRRPPNTGALVELDPELGTGLSDDELVRARATLRVAVRTVRRGEWRIGLAGPVAARSTGLLVLAGVVAREVIIEDVVSSELLGAGDLIVPWVGAAEVGGAGERVRWQVLADLQVAILEPGVSRTLAAFPQISQALVGRVALQGQRAAMVKAFSALNSVERRLLALFRHLAQRWGRVTSHGIVIPLALSHRLLGELIGARRPTVTVAVSALARSERLARLPDGSWRLHDAAETPDVRATGPAVTHRRRLLPDGAHTTKVRSDAFGAHGTTGAQRFRQQS